MPEACWKTLYATYTVNWCSDSQFVRETGSERATKPLLLLSLLGLVPRIQNRLSCLTECSSASGNIRF